MPKLLRNGIIALLLCAALVFVCYQYVDRWVAFWVYSHGLPKQPYFYWFVRIPEVFIVFACILYPILILRFCFGCKTQTDCALLAAIYSLAAAYFFRGPLKIIFGRYWVDTWVKKNPSLLQNNAYGFHWFHKGMTYAAFPSGHTMLIFAVGVVLWMAYPALRWLVALIVFLVMVGLIGMDYHFVGDVIGGAFFGGLIAYYTAKMMGVGSEKSLA